MTNICKICDSPHCERVNGWILSGLSVKELLTWARELTDPELDIDPSDLDKHEANDHIQMDKAKIVAMLIRYNREAQEMIDECMEINVARPRQALGKAMDIRMQTIEMLAKITKLVDQGNETVNQNLTVMLDPDTQRQMLELAVKKLPPKANG